MEFFRFFLNLNLFILLPILVFGIAFYYFNQVTKDNILNNLGWNAYAVSGVIGVPIHEISHLMFHLIFRHRITGLSLYRPFKGKKDGTLGYVNYNYNPMSLYQNIGLFFAGIAPMIGGTLVIILLMKLLLPNTFNSFQFDITNFTFSNLFEVLGANLKNLVSMQDGVFFFIVFFLVACMIAINMDISSADLKNSLHGLIFVEISGLVLSVISCLFDFNIDIMGISAMLIFILIIGLTFSIISVLLSFITLISKAWD